MLQFFKKSSGRSTTDEKTSLPTTQKSKISKRHSMPAAILDESLANDYCDDDGGITQQRSRLSKNLLEIVSDKNCLSYFVQFLDAKNALSHIKFYLDAESFKTAADLSKSSTNLVHKIQQKPTCDKRDSLSEDHSPIIGVCRNSREMTKSTSSEGYDSLSFSSFDTCDRISISSQSESNLRDVLNSSNELDDIHEDAIESHCDDVPELKNLCDLSMRKPLTDDEKSRICAETNKRSQQQQHQQPNVNHSSKIVTENNITDRSIATDAIRIYKKYLITNSQYFIDIPATILSSISLALCSREEDGRMISSISSNCFEEAQKFVLERLEKDFLNEFLESVFYCRYCVDILTSGNLRLADILYSESALFYFMEYLEQEQKRDYLEFWMTAMNFRKHYEINSNQFNKTEAQNDAMVLYEKYFSLQASCPLRISDSVRSRIEESICTENDDIVNCFDLPLRIIENYLEKNFFSNFLLSQLFMNYLKELQFKIKDDKSAELTNAFQRRRHRKTLSDCTSENTKGIRNTLLAMETCRPKTSGQSAGTDMQIDSRQLTNPDLLWHRNSVSGGLTFGRVDSLGRYERDFDLIGSSEEKWSLATGSSRLKNAVRKLVNLPEDRVQEEIAWQVAEMIVKDITNITLGKNVPNNLPG